MSIHPAHSTFRSTRIARFGRAGVIMRARNEPISLEEIAARVPAVLASEAHASRSEKYTYIPTIAVLQGLQREGFDVFEVRQGGTKFEDRRAYTKHMLRLRQRGAHTVGDSFREIVLINSHDGTSSYQLMAGLFRLVCSNGLVVADGQAEGVRIPHKGDVVGDVIEGAYTIVSQGAAIAEQVEHMRAITLNQGEQAAFAEAAAQLRWEEAAPVEAPRLNAPRRSADQGADLWRTFNRVQENLVNGGLQYIQRDANGRKVARRETRPVQGIDGNVALNRALWTLTERMRDLKAA